MGAGAWIRRARKHLTFKTDFHGMARIIFPRPRNAKEAHMPNTIIRLQLIISGAGLVFSTPALAASDSAMKSSAERHVLIWM